MMNLNTSICVVLLGIFALSFALPAEGGQTISPFCTQGNVTSEMKAFCTTMVGGAKTWNEAAISSVNRVQRKAIKSMAPLIPLIESKLIPSMHISKKFQIIDICKRSYDQAVKGLEKCPSLIKDGPFSMYGSTLTAIYTSIEDCRDAIVEEKAQPDIFEVTRFTNSIQKLIDVALIISKSDPRVAEYNARLDSGEFKDSAGDPSLIGPIVLQSTTA